MKKTNSNMIVGFFRFIALMLVVMGMFTAAKAQPTNLNFVFLNDSGYEDDLVWFSWLRSGPETQPYGPSPTNVIYYGAGNTGLVNWSNGGSNLMSDMINYTQLVELVSGSELPGFNLVSANSVNLFVSYGTNAVYDTLATAPAYNDRTANLFPYMPVELNYSLSIPQSGGDVTAINVFSINLGIQNYLFGENNLAPTNAYQRVGFNTNAQTIFNNSITQLVDYTPGQLDNASVIPDAGGNPLRVIPVNSQELGNIGAWQSFSNYLGAIHNAHPTNGSTVLVTNQNGFFRYDNTNHSYFFAYEMNASVDSSNNIQLIGTMHVYTNFGSGMGSFATVNNLTNTLFGALSTNLSFMGLNNGAITSTNDFFATQTTSNTVVAQDHLQSYVIYNQGNAYNTGYSETYTNLANIFITNGIVQGGVTTDTPLDLWNALNVMLQNPMGDYTTGIAGGFVISGYTNDAITSPVGTLSTLEWFSGLGTNIPAFFGTLQPTNTFYNLYAGVITDNSSNSVYSIPFGDRLTGNTVTIGALDVGGTNIGTWVVTLGTPITPVGVPPTPGDKTNIINAITVLTNGAVNIGNVTDDHFWEVINGGQLIITNAPGMTVSARIGNNSDAVDNAAIVTGAGSLWSNAQTVIVGNNGANNSLTIDNGGAFHAGGLRVGSYHTSTGNTVVLNGAGSQMIITNGAGDALTDIRRGTFTQNGGTFRTDRLNVTDAAGLYDFNGGTAFVGVANINNGQNFQVGNGTDTAFFRLAQNGQTNTFANGITINDNATFSLGGVVTNQITIGSGGTLKGQGTYVGDLTVGNGATLSVGNSPGSLTNVGTLTWGGSGTNIWEINSFTGTQGTDPGWDFIRVEGILDITATSGDQFFLDIASLTLGNTAGLAAGFNDASDYNFILVETTLGVSGFASDKFNLSTANFQNPFTGTWSLGVSGNDLMLYYTATVIPEPSTYALLALGAICVGFALRRRHQQKTPANTCSLQQDIAD